jgi:hypothetical protein
LTAAEKQQSAIAELNEALSSNPDCERCTADGTPDPNGRSLGIAQVCERVICQKIRSRTFELLRNAQPLEHEAVEVAGVPLNSLAKINECHFASANRQNRSEES